MRLVARAVTSTPEPYTYRYTLWPGEPWRDRPDAHTIASLPAWWLRSIADPAELAAASQHHYRLDGLRLSIHEIGIHTPLVVHFDQTGRVCLADGHHRLAIANEEGVVECPAVLRTVPRIGGYAVPVGPAITALVTAPPPPRAASAAPTRCR